MVVTAPILKVMATMTAATATATATAVTEVATARAQTKAATRTKTLAATNDWTRTATGREGEKKSAPMTATGSLRQACVKHPMQRRRPIYTV